MKISEVLGMNAKIQSLAVTSIEGILSGVFKPRPTEKNGKSYWFQDFELRDGNDVIKGSFGDQSLEMDQSQKGRRVRFSCTNYGGKWNGVTVRHDEKYSKVNKLSISKSAKIEFLDGTAAQPQRTSNHAQQGESQTRKDSPNRPQATSRNGAQVGNAINNAALLIANKLIPCDGDAFVVLEESAKKILGIADRLEVGAKEEPKEAVKGWRDYKHPKNDSTLGSLTEEKQVELIKWAWRQTKDGLGRLDKEIQLYHAQVILMAAELNITQEGLFISAGADKKDLEDYIFKSYETPLCDLSQDQWAAIYENFNNILSNCNDQIPY